MFEDFGRNLNLCAGVYVVVFDYTCVIYIHSLRYSCYVEVSVVCTVHVSVDEFNHQIVCYKTTN